MGYAAPVCVTGTFDSYLSLGSGGCTIDDKLFNNFVLAPLTTRAAPGTNIIPDATPLNPGSK